jgi:hypothetical protein
MRQFSVAEGAAERSLRWQQAYVSPTAGALTSPPGPVHATAAA